MESIRKLRMGLIFGVVCVHMVMGKICPYSDPACDNCYEERVSCKNLPQIPPLTTGANVYPVKEVSFMGGNIKTISKNDLPPGLTFLHLLDHPLTNISEDALDRSAATLEIAFFGRAKFSSLPTALKKLTKLKKLIVEDTPVQVWDTDTLKHLVATVEDLKLKNVSFSSWPSWISDFRSLNRLDLSWNSLKSVPDDAFDAIKNELTMLNLEATGLTHVPKALSTLTSLDFLNLRNNSFTDVSEFHTITGSPFAKKLSSLDLRSTGLNTMVDFSNMTNLSNLDLSNNRISDVPAGSLPTSLSMLLFPGNRLSSVPKDIARMSQLGLVGLHNNLISVIEPNSFPLSLIYLNLESNKLTAITNTAFKDLKLLKSLFLSENPISVIEPLAFSDLASLETLYIDSMYLTEIPLAFTALKPKTHISLTLTRPVSCTCPAPPQLVTWFTSLDNKWSIDVKCSNGQPIGSYLSDGCRKKPVAP